MSNVTAGDSATHKAEELKSMIKITSIYMEVEDDVNQVWVNGSI